jgi:hypothetical protein
VSSDWIPLRWSAGPLDQEKAKDIASLREAINAWLDPKVLSFLDGGPVNAILVTWAAGGASDAAQQSALQPIVAEAKKKNLAVIGRVTGKSADVAAKSAAAAGLAAIVTDAVVAPVGDLKVIPSVEAQGAGAVASPVVALAKSAWPRIPTEWRSRSGNRGRGGAAGPTGAPWVEANGWVCALATAKAPGKTIWVLAEPPEDVVGYRPAHFALAVADAAAYGGMWVPAFDAETRMAVAKGSGNSAWKAVADAIRFFTAKKEWAGQQDFARLGLVSDFAGPNEFIGEEMLNLMARRHVPYRVVDRPKVTPASLNGLKAVVWLDSDMPSAAMKTALASFVNAGGVLIGPKNGTAFASGPVVDTFAGRFNVYKSGNGKVALATEDWGDPWLSCADTHQIIGRKYDMLRTFNATSCNVRLTGGPSKAVAHVVSYTARPIGEQASIYVAHPYKSARLLTLSGGGAQALEVRRKGEGVEVYLPEFASYAAVEFEG